MSPKGCAPAKGPELVTYAGYDFSAPFRVDVFLRKHVGLATPFSTTHPFRVAEAPEFGFLRIPALDARDETPFIVTKAPWLDVLQTAADGTIVRRLAPIFATCGGSHAFQAAPGDSLLIPGDIASAVVVLSPRSQGVVCARAEAVSNAAL